MAHFAPDSTKFSSCGREDVDVRMLGDGRPFVLEVIFFFPKKKKNRHLKLNHSIFFFQVANPRKLRIRDDNLRGLKFSINYEEAGVFVNSLMVFFFSFFLFFFFSFFLFFFFSFFLFFFFSFFLFFFFSFFLFFFFSFFLFFFFSFFLFFFFSFFLFFFFLFLFLFLFSFLFSFFLLKNIFTPLLFSDDH